MMIRARWNPPSLMKVNTEATIMVMQTPTVTIFEITFMLTSQVGIFP